MNELQKFLERIFGKDCLTLAEGTEMNEETAFAAIQELVNSRNTLQTTVDNLTTEKTSLTEQVTNLNAEVANLKEMAQVGKNHIASLRENAVATYKKLMGDKADETIVTMLNAETTGMVTLISLTKDYQARLEEKFPMTCSKCGSHDVSRASSATEAEDKSDNKATAQNSEKSTEEILKGIYSNKLK